MPRVNLSFVDGRDDEPKYVEGVEFEVVPRIGEKVGHVRSPLGGNTRVLHTVVDVRHYTEPHEIHLMLSDRP